MATALAIPCLNEESNLRLLFAELERQTVQPDAVLVLDCSSEDGTRAVAAQAGARVIQIARAEFNHGHGRQLLLEQAGGCQQLIYMTADALPANEHSIARLLAALEAPGVAAAYGRQLPKRGADPIEQHKRHFNYPPHGAVRSLADAPRLGVRTAFCSDVFAAYRVDALRAIGGFPRRVIIAEDALVAGSLLLAGWKIAYAADAEVFHSHNYGFLQEFRRHFDTGVFYAREAWFTDAFGGAGREGWNFICSEMKHLARNHPARIPAAIARGVAKFTGFRLGLNEGHLPLALKQRLGLYRAFWATEPGAGVKPAARGRGAGGAA